VFFPQEHQPGHLGAFDFTYCGELGVTIAGVHFVHLLFQFVLAWSGWRPIAIAICRGRLMAFVIAVAWSG
jgi:hypothetical protein